MSELNSDAFRIDLQQTLERIAASSADYLVPVPRKTVKLMKLHPTLFTAAGRSIVYTTSFYWSPSRSALAGRRVAVIDDATLRGVTLRRHRMRFEQVGALVDTYAVYKCDYLPEVPEVPEVCCSSGRP